MSSPLETLFPGPTELRATSNLPASSSIAPPATSAALFDSASVVSSTVAPALSIPIAPPLPVVSSLIVWLPPEIVTPWIVSVEPEGSPLTAKICELPLASISVFCAPPPSIVSGLVSEIAPSVIAYGVSLAGSETVSPAAALSIAWRNEQSPVTP